MEEQNTLQIQGKNKLFLGMNNFSSFAFPQKFQNYDHSVSFSFIKLQIIIKMINRLQNGSMPSPTLNTSLRASQPSSTHSQKLSSLFLTQKRKYNPHQAEIFERHAQLNHYIEQLDAKVQKIVQHNEAELLFAYKNHLESIKIEMSQFKEETQQALQGEAINREKIQIMQKQIIVFREQALKLFEKALKKDKVIQQLQFKLDEILSEKEHMDRTVKDLIKRNKELQAIIKTNENHQQEQTNEYFKRIQVNSFASLGLSTNKKKLTKDNRMKNRVFTKTSYHDSKAFTQQNFKSKQLTQPNYDLELEQLQKTKDAELFARRLKLKLSFIEPKMLSTIIQSAAEVYSLLDNKQARTSKIETFQPRQTKSSLRSKSFHTCESNQKLRKSLSRYSHHRQLSSDGTNVQLRDCFKRCVEVVRKDIARRKQINTLNFFKDGCPISLQQFKKVDLMRLIQMVFANQKLMQVIYWNLFNTAP